MNKSAEFEVSFTPILTIDVKQFKKEFLGRTKYYLGANVFTIFSSGHLVISSPTNISHLNCDTWMSTVKLLSENPASANVFISIKDEKRGVELCYECELPKY